VPNLLQYRLERERELQHRWNRLLQRSVAPKDHSSRSPLSSVVRSNLRNSPRPAATHRPPRYGPNLRQPTSTIPQRPQLGSNSLEVERYEHTK
jgi:hypothetical protein